MSTIKRQLLRMFFKYYNIIIDWKFLGFETDLFLDIFATFADSEYKQLHHLENTH